MKKGMPVIILVLVVVGVGGYFLMSKKTPSMNEKTIESGDATQQQVGQESELVEKEETEENYVGSMLKMVGMGMPLKCTWEAEGSAGTTWVKGENVYGEFEAEGQKSKMIFKDDCTWVWQEGQTQGVKVCYEPEEAEQFLAGEVEGVEQPQVRAGSLPDVDYRCAPAVVTEEKFTPPANIEFMDIAEMMQGLGM